MAGQETPSIVQDTDFVEAVLGGGGHSPEPPQTPAQKSTTDAPAGDFGEEPDSPFADSAQSEQGQPKVSEEDVAKYKAEAEKWKAEAENRSKRLHDTQEAFHKASAERSQLAEELKKLREKENDDDDWFGEDDRQRREDLQSRIDAADASIRKMDQDLKDAKKDMDAAAEEANNAAWERDSAPVRAEHPDFDDVVYETVGELVFGDSPDPAVVRAYRELKDKSPAGVYAFGRKLKDKLDILRDPDGFRQRVIGEATGIAAPARPVGKEGLDMVNSASAPATPNDGADWVGAIFK